MAQGERGIWSFLDFFWAPTSKLFVVLKRKPMGFDVPPILRSTHVLGCEMRCDAIVMQAELKAVA